ncbi:MAG: hypothetical protein M1817_001473 [Caeruleum heppii]|nr:MAG: hypothetical protein M1817_001473 [Caeruleum heppii]
MQAPSAKPKHAMTQAAPPDSVHYTVFVRLPFPRNSFVDPPPIEWDSTKERALWQVLSQSAGGSEIKWQELADEFDVSLPFLLQQSAWLYDRQFSQLRAQMRKVGTSTTSNAPSPIPGSASGSTLGAQPMKRGPSGGAGPRVPSSLSVRSRDSPVPRAEGSMLDPSPGEASSRPPTRSRNDPLSHRRPTEHARRPSHVGTPNTEHRFQPPPNHRSASAPRDSPEPSESSGNSSPSASETQHPPMQSQIFRRPASLAVKGRHEQYDRDEEDDEEEEDPAFLPFSSEATPAGDQDPGATLREHPPSGEETSRATSKPLPSLGRRPQTTQSSASSSSSQPQRHHTDGARSYRPPPGPLSPRRAAELAGRSPRRRGIGAGGREGSDGDKGSMGSSFSDLDDTSVTQSALEEALLSNMQAGGMASRMSTISQALKSRYL